MSAGEHWQQRPEGGSRFLILLIRGIARYGGRWLSRPLLIPITLYFLVMRGPERRASRAYLGRVFGRPATLWEVAKHIHSFAATILDRVFMLSGQFRSFDLEISGLTELHDRIDLGRGVLLFGSHHGSFEALRVLSRERPDVQVRVVMDRGQNAVVTQTLEALCPEIARTVIDASQDGTSITLAIREALEEGALVSLLVDRARGAEPVQWVNFLGRPAPFPSAPFLIAAALKVPVLICFGLYFGGRRYGLHFEVFDEGIDLPRAQRAHRLLALQQRYVARLEEYVHRAPYNWFNFYDFWRQDAAPPADAVPAAGAVAGPVDERRKPAA
jgi:predicted LPLAT superfamily acyltransferase